MISKKRYAFFMTCLLAMFAALGSATALDFEIDVDNPHEERGPCKALTFVNPAVPGCATTCILYCSDPCRAITYTEGECRNLESTPCQEVDADFTKAKCRECSCIYPFSVGGTNCLDYGLYDSGTVSKQTCADGA